MSRPAFFLLLLGIAPAFVVAADAPELSSRQHNWALYLFTPEGYHSMNLAGEEDHIVSKDQVDVVNLSIIAFAGDASARITTILRSPVASFFNKEQRASGPGAVDMIRDDCEVTGEDWTYARDGERVSIHRHVRVQFNEQLPGILK